MRDDLKLYYQCNHDDDPYSLRQTMENISGSDFERVLRYWENDGYGPVFETMDMDKSSTRVRITGLDIDDDHSSCTPPIDLLRLPVTPGDTWDGETTLVVDGTSIVMSYSAQVSAEIYRERWSNYKKAPSYNVWLDDCFDVGVTYTMTIAGESSPVESGEMRYFYAPGLGIIAHWYELSIWDGATEPEELDGEYYLWAAGVDDRYDIDD